MRIAYLDCSSGISGDMTVAALVDAGVDPQAIIGGIASLGLPGVEISFQQVMRCAFRALHLRITHPEQHAHRHLADIHAILDRGSLAPRQKQLALRIFHEIAKAEATVHGTTVDQIHFHEVGAIDSIVDIVASAIGFDLLGVEEVISSPIPTGRGQVRIAHGVCTVPTPGTAELLKGVPLVDVPVNLELTTPTGAAILKAVVDRFGPIPSMTIESIGHGAGTKDLTDRANMLRILVGEATTADAEHDEVLVLETNLDDVSGEIVGYTKQRLLAAGALDVYSIPLQMKKDRPGVLLGVICRPADQARLEAILFEETQTFGIRRTTAQRTKRTRVGCSVKTPWGEVAGKLGRHAGQLVFTPEYEACAQIARQFAVPLREVYRSADEAFRAQDPAVAQTLLAKSDAPAPVISPQVKPVGGHSHDHGHDHSHDHSHDHGHDHR